MKQVWFSTRQCQYGSCLCVSCSHLLATVFICFIHRSCCTTCFLVESIFFCFIQLNVLFPLESIVWLDVDNLNAVVDANRSIIASFWWKITQWCDSWRTTRKKEWNEKNPSVSVWRKHHIWYDQKGKYKKWIFDAIMIIVILLYSLKPTVHPVSK